MNTVEFYEKNGYAILKNAIPETLINQYEKLWLDHHSQNGQILNYHGWTSSSSYMNHKEILDILCHENIFNFLKLLNNNIVLHLSFTSWVSTRKAWHQDWTKADKQGANNYFGVWVALDKIDPNSGPFQFIPGSHNWDIDYNLIYDKSNKDQVSNLLIQESLKREALAYSFLPDKGDLIIWNGHLIHRGSDPVDENILRKSIIGHYGIINGNIVSHKTGFYHSDKSSAIDLYK
jgi:ectoine hydroxylase-related dioxygenase (phytanoyl-CoA dioxygenase family)